MDEKNGHKDGPAVAYIVCHGRKTNRGKPSTNTLDTTKPNHDVQGVSPIATALPRQEQAIAHFFVLYLLPLVPSFNPPICPPSTAQLRIMNTRYLFLTLEKSARISPPSRPRQIALSPRPPAPAPTSRRRRLPSCYPRRTRRCCTRSVFIHYLICCQYFY